MSTRPSEGDCAGACRAGRQMGEEVGPGTDARKRGTDRGDAGDAGAWENCRIIHRIGPLCLFLPRAFHGIIPRIQNIGRRRTARRRSQISYYHEERLPDRHAILRESAKSEMLGRAGGDGTGAGRRTEETGRQGSSAPIRTKPRPGTVSSARRKRAWRLRQARSHAAADRSRERLQYSHHTSWLADLAPRPHPHRGHWSGTWPGPGRHAQSHGSLTKAGVRYSTLWSGDFTDAFF